MTSRGFRSLALALALSAAVLAGSCAGGRHQRRLFIPPSLRASAILVYPFSFRWDEPAYRSFELAQRLVQVVDTALGDQVLLFGPGEFKVYRPDDNNAWAATNAVSLLPLHRLKPEQAVVLRAWCERRVVSSRQDVVDSKGRPLGAKAVEETTYLGHVELVHPSTQFVLVEMVGDVTPDPFAVRADDEPDPAPELTLLMTKLVEDALQPLKTHWRPAGAPRWPVEPAPLELRSNPAALYTFGEAGRPSLEYLLAALDPVERDLLKIQRVRFLNPELSFEEATRLTRLPPGLHVVSAPPGLKLQPGQLVTEVRGEQALPQMLQRARLSPDPVPIKVRQPTGKYEELAL